MFPQSQQVKLPTPLHLETPVKIFCSTACKDQWIKAESVPCTRCNQYLFKQSSMAKCKLGKWYCSDKCAFNLQMGGGAWSTTAAPAKAESEEI